MGRGADMTPPLRWRLGVAGGVALVVLLVDQLTKLAVRAVGDALHVTVIPGVIDFLFVRNIGAAFSMGEGHGIAFAVLALAVVMGLFTGGFNLGIDFTGGTLITLDLGGDFATADVEKVLDDVIFINQGQLVLQSSVDEIREEKGMSVDALFREVFKC
mgnify:CR=1 FL=1